MLIGLEAAGILGAAMVAPVVLLVYAAARRQETVELLPLADRVRRKGVDPAALTRPGTCVAVASAIAVCRRCEFSGLCRRRLAAGENDDVERFCPNSALVQRLAEHGTAQAS